MRDERKNNKVMREERGERKENKKNKTFTIFVVLFTHVKNFGIYNTLCEWLFGI